MRRTALSVANPRGGVKPARWRAPATAGDVLLVVAILMMAVVLIVARPDGGTPRLATVQTGDDTVHTLRLDGPQRVEIPGPVGVSVVVVEAGRVRVEASPCRQQICVGRGWLQEVGDVAVCVPNRLVVRVEGQGARGFDGVTR